jgi:hypothetical protein
MRFINRWRIVMIIAIVVIAIPIAARVSPTQPALVMDRQAKVHQQTTAYTEAGAIADTKSVNAGIRRSLTPPQDYYDRRRAYWEDRMERRAEYLEEEDGNDDDSADSDDGKDEDSAAADDDEGSSMDDEEELIERRREYWQQRLDRDW